MSRYADYLRWLYKNGRPNRLARLQNRTMAAASTIGIYPKRLAALKVRGRRSGREISFPVVIADYEGERYLVSMLGAEVNWVRNLEAAKGNAVLCHGRREIVQLVEVPVEDRPPILRHYLSVAPGARPHIPVDRHSQLEEFASIAPQTPVFRICSVAITSGPGN